MMLTAQSKTERHDGRYKGVRMRKWGKWVAEVRQPNSRNRIWLGSYDSAQEAGRVYDAAVFCLLGPSAVTNFPDDPPPEVMLGAELSPSQIQLAASKHTRKVLVGGVELGASKELRPSVVENPRKMVVRGTELGASGEGRMVKLGASKELRPPVVENPRRMVVRGTELGASGEGRMVVRGTELGESGERRMVVPGTELGESVELSQPMVENLFFGEGHEMGILLLVRDFLRHA